MESINNDKDVGKPDVEFRLYRRRWYILLIYSSFSFTQSAVWNTWGPISTPSEDAFDWHDFTIAWMNNWGPISYVLTGLLFPWLLQVKGLRWAVLTSMFCVAVGTSLRVISSEPKTATILIHIGQFINGLGGPISTGAIPVVSATWFPPTERVMATAISNSINMLGAAAAYIIGPILVPDVSLNKSSVSHAYLLFQNYDSSPSIFLEASNITFARKAKERGQIMKYMYYSCAFAVCLFIVQLCYFPRKPPHPPCMSASMERQQYWAGIASLRTKGYFLIVTLLFGVSTGVFGAWSSVLNINLKTVNVHEETAGWMGFYSTLAGCVGSAIVGSFADRFVRCIKLLIITMYILTTAALVLFSLMLINVLPCTVVGLYATTIIANTAINIAVPLLFELSCELAYPTGEGSANGALTLFSNFWAVLFLAVFSLPNVGTMWMNWTVIASTAGCIPLLLILKGRLRRLEVDTGLPPLRCPDDIVVVSGGMEDDDPLLVYEDVNSEVCAMIDDVSSDKYGIENPILKDASITSD